MKRLSMLTAACVALLAFQACNDGSSPDAIKSANESNEVKMDSAKHSDSGTAMTTPVSEADSKFAVKAASGGMMEVQLGELAQQKAMNQRVKDFGAMMVRDHTKANDELKSLAGMKNITLPPAPGEDHMDQIKKLSGKSGKEFDKDYVKMMVDDHEKDIKEFEDIANNGNDADVKAFASKTLPTLRMHLDSIKAIRDAMKK
ncbi:MAG: DUF4142 domain-containing protein [Chitinophagaceae bacterium]|nr:DUF4142 domain-containing protein [Chitinophagaceae bacterium]